MNAIKAYHTHYVVPNYELGQCKFLEEKLSVWDDTYFKYKPKGFIYNEEKKELYVERGVDPEFLKWKWMLNIVQIKQQLQVFVYLLDQEMSIKKSLWLFFQEKISTLIRELVRKQL